MAPLRVSDLLSEYKLTPKMRKQIKAAFDGLGSAGVAYKEEDMAIPLVDRTPSRFAG